MSTESQWKIKLWQAFLENNKSQINQLLEDAQNSPLIQKLRDDERTSLKNWEPLLTFTSQTADSFMFMGKNTYNNFPIFAYKHRTSRGYLHLDIHGKPYAWNGLKYAPISIDIAIHLAKNGFKDSIVPIIPRDPEILTITETDQPQQNTSLHTNPTNTVPPTTDSNHVSGTCQQTTGLPPGK